MQAAQSDAFLWAMLYLYAPYQSSQAAVVATERQCALTMYRCLLIGWYRTVDVSYAPACRVMTIIMCSMVEGYPGPWP